MANKLSRSAGNLQQVTGRAAVGDVPDFAVDTGAAGRVLEQLGGSLSARLGQMADQATAREGEAAGLTAGQRAGERYLKKAQGDASAAGKPNTKADVVVGPGEASAGPQSLNSTPLQLRHDGTIRGENFDAAALKTYGWRFQAGLATDIGAAAQQNADSPAGFEKAVAGIQTKYTEDGLVNSDPKIREIFDQTLAERLAPARLAIAARHEAALKAAAKDAADQGTDAVRAELERNAYSLGANPAADWMLKPSIARAMTAIDREIKDGTFSAKEGAAKKQALTSAVVNARTTGTFDALPTPDAKQDFALGVMQSWKDGKGAYADLSLKEAKGLSDSLYQRATAEATRLTAAQKGEKARLEDVIKDDLASVAGSGVGLDAQQAGLSPDRVQLLLGQDGYDKWQADRSSAQQAWQATAGMELETPAELQQRLEAIKPKPGEANYADSQKIYEAATKRKGEILEERKTDPLGQANRGGLVAIKAIDTTTPEALVSSLQLRAQQARVVSSAYGTPLTVFRPEEKTSLSSALLDNPTLLPAFSRSVEEAMGDAAPKALSELSDAGPELAHAAGLGMATGDNSVADDIARVLGGRKDGSFKAKMPTDNAIGDAAGAVLGDSLSQNDAARGAIIGTANLLFEKDANTLGFDPSTVNKPGTPAAAAYERAISRALGSRMVDGVQYGGLSEVNGVQIVAPTFMPADQPQQLLGTLRDSDLGFLPKIASANGVPITAADLRQAHLVTVGDGLYRVALGDPQSFDPQYVAAQGGGFWTLDMKTLQSLHGLSEFNPASLSPQGADPGQLLRNLFDHSGADTP